ncbi:putative cyclin-dependent kinase F-2 [Miscanthus floridulus]|uniref:putative cyclin-dependent kinase F-2 n=1 Tax=Miscanthus floridulus TaxID=154761 RepID=UPI0034597C13
MAAVSELEEELPEEKSNAAAVLAFSPVPWLAAVAERYERREKLGEGMFRDVYKAWDRVLERFVAVKWLSGSTDDRFVATPLPDFEWEVMSLAACRGHPSVVQLLAAYADYSRADGDCFVVTEYAGPMNLRQYVRRLNGQPFDEDEVRDVMEQLLAGTSRRRRRTGTTPGPGPLASASPYRAPDLFLGSKDYDGRVDTWSLGCIMAELVAGNGVPFFGAPDGEVFKKMLQRVGTEGIIEWQGLERVVPAEKVAFLRKMVSEEGGHLQLPEVLSPAGFKVLEGLLDSNPDRRLSAAAALRKQWFRRGCLFGAWCFMPRGDVAP